MVAASATSASATTATSSTTPSSSTRAPTRPSQPTVVVSSLWALLIRSAHNDETTTVGWDGRVGALVEEDGVVLDVAVVAEADVADAATISGAQVAAHPVEIGRASCRERVSRGLA